MPSQHQLQPKNDHISTLSSLFRRSNWPAILSLIQTNPDPALYISTLPCGHTPLQLASLLGSHAVVAALLNLGLQVDPASLFNAANHGHVQVIRLLLQPVLGHPTCTKHFCNCPTAVPSAGRALHAAAWSVSGDAANAILQALCPAGKLAALQYRAHDGAMPLHVAALSGDVDLARALVDSGADLFATDSTNKTPLDWAKRYVVAAGTGQSVVDLLVQAEEKALAPPAWPHQQYTKEDDHRRHDPSSHREADDPRFSDRPSCLPPNPRQTTTTPPPPCHAA